MPVKFNNLYFLLCDSSNFLPKINFRIFHDSLQEYITLGTEYPWNCGTHLHDYDLCRYFGSRAVDGKRSNRMLPRF